MIYNKTQGLLTKSYYSERPERKVEYRCGVTNRRRSLQKCPIQDIDYRIEGGSCICCHCERKNKDTNHIRKHIRVAHFGITTHRCPRCDLTFKYDSHLTVHKLEAHNIDDRKKCNDCDATYNSKVQLRDHMRIFHKLGKKLQCDICEYVTYYKPHMCRHRKSHNTERNFLCGHCGKCFKSPRSNSSFKSYSPPPHQDDSVGNKKRLPRQAIQFMKTWLADHVEHPYPSEEEKEAMASQLNLTLLQVSNWFINARRRILPLLEDDDQSANEHDQTPVEGTDYRFEGENCVCCHCGKVYLRFGSSEMMNHIKWEHFMIPRYTCQECGLGFTKEGPMIAHKLQEHEIDERKKCPECESLFNTKPLLEYHMRTIHQMSKKMQCEFCHFESYSKQAMRDHNLNHKDERNFPCKRCGKAFKIRKQLKQHEYIHSRERKIVCKECGKSFAQRGSITYHMAKYHPGVKF
ncbi:homeobox KN domain-containing protein [Phthorimaea operculella]|nr:homeobox KN domain-containing protein [Phthorimaea operculella]